MKQSVLFGVAMSAMLATACSSSSSDSKKSSAGPVTASVSGGGSRTEGGPVGCENPIVVDDNGGDLSGIKGRFKLDQIQLYSVASPSNDSFLASASSADGFKVSLDCKAVRDVTQDNSSKNWTDEDGSMHSQSQTHTSDVNADFAAGEEIEMGGSSPSPTQRKIAVSFKNGQLASALTSIIPTPPGASNGIEQLPKGPMDAGRGVKLTINSTVLNTNSFEIRLKIESATDNGTRITEFGRAVYVRK